jgi:hypothetical protein
MQASDFRDLVAGMDSGYLCDYLQIHTRTLKRWKEGTAAVPHSAVIALRLKLDGDLSAVGGDDWTGFVFARDGRLYAPYFRGGFTALQICGMFFERQELSWLRREVKRLDAELQLHQANAWAERKVRQLTSRALSFRPRS